MNRTSGSRELRKQIGRDTLRIWLYGNRLKKLQKLARLQRLVDKETGA